MDLNSCEIAPLIERASCGDQASLQELLGIYSERLHRMVAIRMDRRLAGRVDVTDIIQEIHIEVWCSLPNFVKNSEQSFYFWLRGVAANKLLEFHRFHLGTKMRDAKREVPIRSLHSMETSANALTDLVYDTIDSPSEMVMHDELKVQLWQAIDRLDSLDREVLELRYFAQLSSTETAAVLGISMPAAGMRYHRAVKRLKSLLQTGSPRFAAMSNGTAGGSVQTAPIGDRCVPRLSRG